jgi:hypothetical protein
MDDIFDDDDPKQREKRLDRACKEAIKGISSILESKQAESLLAFQVRKLTQMKNRLEEQSK